MSLNKEGDLCGKHAQSAFSAFSWHSACRHKALLVHRAVPARKADPVRKGHRVPARPGPTTRRIPGKNPQTRVANRISARALVSQAKAGPQHRTRLDQEAKAKAGPDLRRRAGNKNPNTQLLTHGAALDMAAPFLYALLERGFLAIGMSPYRTKAMAGLLVRRLE